MNHSDWVEQISDGDAINAIATKAGIVHRTFARQVERSRISAENVIAIAIAYKHHPVGALVDTGYLDEKWATQVDPARALRAVTEDELADEVLRRMKIGVKRNGPLDTPVDELAQRRHVTPSAYSDTTPDEEDLPYVADSSPTEPEPGDDDYSDGP